MTARLSDFEMVDHSAQMRASARSGNTPHRVKFFSVGAGKVTVEAGLADRPFDPEDMETLYGLLAEARAVVTRLETLLAGNAAGPQPHPIVAWRRRRNMSQRALAKAVGISGPALCYIEHSPGLSGRPETRAMIAKILDVPEEWLVGPDRFGS